MNKIFSTLKKIQIKQVVTAFVLGILLFVTQACSSVTAKTPDSTYEGGMNGYSDVDPRSKDVEAAAKMKAKALKDKVNVMNGSDDLIDRTEENLEDLGKNIKYGVQDAADEAQDNAEDLAKGTKRGIENIKDDTSDAVNELTNNVQATAEDAKLSTQRAVKNAKLSTQRAVEDAKLSTQRAVEDASNTVERTFQDIVD